MQIAPTNAAVWMRTAFPGRTFNASANTHTAAIEPVTPNAACARRMMSLVVIAKVLSDKPGWAAISRFVVVRLLAPGPIKPQVGIILRLADGGMPVAEQQLKTGV